MSFLQWCNLGELFKAPKCNVYAANHGFIIFGLRIFFQCLVQIPRKIMCSSLGSNHDWYLSMLVKAQATLKCKGLLEPRRKSARYTLGIGLCSLRLSALLPTLVLIPSSPKCWWLGHSYFSILTLDANFKQTMGADS